MNENLKSEKCKKWQNTNVSEFILVITLPLLCIYCYFVVYMTKYMLSSGGPKL